MENRRENWTSKIGVILAVAGSAIGLGNFLRFPVKAASFGGGAFLIPYFIALLLLGIPLAWVEWTLGRFGGQFMHGSGPGILNVTARKPWAKYLGSIGVFGPLLIFFYYVYIESWLLGFCYYSLTGELLQAVQAGQISQFFSNYITLKTTIFSNFPTAIFFFLITFFINFLIIYFGIRKGIEIISEFALPVLFILGMMLFIRVLTVPNIGRGLGFMWNPDFSKLLNFRVWLEATGQMFFTLSVGIGAILTYASYVKKKQDIALSSLSANAANEFAEVILGGTIVIPLAIVVYGAHNIQDIATMGTFGLSFNTMPVIFNKIPLGALFQFIWFFLLFIAGVTSSISVLQPGISFFEDEVGLSKKRAVTIVGFFSLIMGLIAAFGLTCGAVDEMDFWGGTFALVVFGAIEAIIFAWVFGIKRGWQELNQGADIKVPLIYRFILKYVTPIYLIVLLTGYIMTDFWKVITLSNLTNKKVVVQENVHPNVKTEIISLQKLKGLLDNNNPTLFIQNHVLTKKAIKLINIQELNLGLQKNNPNIKIELIENTDTVPTKKIVTTKELQTQLDNIMVNFLGFKMINTLFITTLRLILLTLLITINVIIFIVWRTRKLDNRIKLVAASLKKSVSVQKKTSLKRRK